MVLEVLDKVSFLGVRTLGFPPIENKVPPNPIAICFSPSQASTSVASPSFMACVRPFCISSITS